MGFIEHFRKLDFGRKALFIVSTVFLALYFGLGVVFLTVQHLPFAMSHTLKTGFGLLLIAYSIFRVMRLVKGVKNGTE